jgi:hypothetical protein
MVVWMALLPETYHDEGTHALAIAGFALDSVTIVLSGWRSSHSLEGLHVIEVPKQQLEEGNNVVWLFFRVQTKLQCRYVWLREWSKGWLGQKSAVSLD